MWGTTPCANKKWSHKTGGLWIEGYIQSTVDHPMFKTWISSHKCHQFVEIPFQFKHNCSVDFVQRSMVACRDDSKAKCHRVMTFIHTICWFCTQRWAEQIDQVSSISVQIVTRNWYVIKVKWEHLQSVSRWNGDKRWACNKNLWPFQKLQDFCLIFPPRPTLASANTLR